MHKKLAEILIDTFGVSENDINEAQRVNNASGSGRLGETLVAQNIVTETQLLKALSLQYDIPLWLELPLDNFGIEFTQQIPIQFLKKYVMVPLTSDRPVAADSQESV
jgi:general secretion pathway protein E